MPLDGLKYRLPARFKVLAHEWEVPRGLGFSEREIRCIERLQQFLQSLELWARVLESSGVDGNGSQVVHHLKSNVPSIVFFLFTVRHIKLTRSSLMISREDFQGFRRRRPPTSEITDLLGLSRIEKQAHARSNLNLPETTLSPQLSDRPSDSLPLHSRQTSWKRAYLDIVMSRVCKQARAWQTHFQPPLQSGYRRIEWICVCRPSPTLMNI